MEGAAGTTDGEFRGAGIWDSGCGLLLTRLARIVLDQAHNLTIAGAIPVAATTLGAKTRWQTRHIWFRLWKFRGCWLRDGHTAVKIFVRTARLLSGTTG